VLVGRRAAAGRGEDLDEVVRAAGLGRVDDDRHVVAAGDA